MLKKFFGVILSLFRFKPDSSFFEGTVRWIPDGDTIHLEMPDESVKKIRLFGIDAPEIGRTDDNLPPQDGSMEAVSFLRSASRGQTLRVEALGTDKFGRILGLVSLPGASETLNESMAREGHAWHHPSRDIRHSASEAIERLAEQARRERRGLWENPSPMHPKDFRKSAGFGKPYAPSSRMG